MSLIKKLRAPWPADFSLQPATPSERINVSEVQALKNLAADEIESLRDWIKREGERTGTCTYRILHDVCKGCKCSDHR